MKISPKDENILIFGENSPVDPLRFPQNMRIDGLGVSSGFDIRIRAEAW